MDLDESGFRLASKAEQLAFVEVVGMRGGGNEGAQAVRGLEVRGQTLVTAPCLDTAVVTAGFWAEEEPENQTPEHRSLWSACTLR